MIYDMQKSILYTLFVYLIDTNERSFRYIMSGSTFGTLFRVTTWGESHGPGVGVVIDGCPAGIPLSEQDIQQFLDRRKPGQSKYTTKRNESDSVEILSGVFEGTTTGTPISLLVRNQDQRSRDYGNIAIIISPREFTARRASLRIFRTPFSSATSSILPSFTSVPCMESPAQILYKISAPSFS